MIKVKLFKPGYPNSMLNDFLATHKIMRIKAYPHARKAGIGNYVGVTYREEGNINATQIQADRSHQS